MAFVAFRELRIDTLGTQTSNEDCLTPFTPGAQDDYAFFRSFVAAQAAKDSELASILAELQRHGSSDDKQQDAYIPTTAASCITAMQPEATDCQSERLHPTLFPPAAEGAVQVVSDNGSKQQGTKQPAQKHAVAPDADAAAKSLVAVSQPACGAAAVAPGAATGKSPSLLSHATGRFSKPDFTRREIKSLRRLFPIQSPLVKSAAMLEGEYQLLDLLGRGAFGTAYKARHLASNELVCVKTVEAAHGQTPADVERQKREVAVLAALKHPNIIRYHDCFSDGSKLHIVMEWAAGGDLQNLINRHAKAGTRLTEEQLLTYFVQIVAALAHIHAAGVMHRDLKTSNVLFGGSGLIKLADFGIAKVLDAPGDNSSSGSRLSSSNGGAAALIYGGPLAQSFVGTPNYLAPEMINCEPYNQKADVWAMGCLLYELAALRPAFKADRIPLVYRLIRRGRLSPLPSCYSPELKALLQQLMAKNPNDRPSSGQLLQYSLLRPYLDHYQQQLQQLGLELPSLPTPPTGYSTSGTGSTTMSSSNGGCSSTVSASGFAAAVHHQQQLLPTAAPIGAHNRTALAPLNMDGTAGCYTEQQLQYSGMWSIKTEPGLATGPALVVPLSGFTGTGNATPVLDGATRYKADNFCVQPGCLAAPAAFQPGPACSTADSDVCGLTHSVLEHINRQKHIPQNESASNVSAAHFELLPTLAAVRTGRQHTSTSKQMHQSFNLSGSKSIAAQLHKCLKKMFKSKCHSRYSRSANSSADGSLTGNIKRQEQHHATAVTSVPGHTPILISHLAASCQFDQKPTDEFPNEDASTALFGSINGGLDKVPPLSAPDHAGEQQQLQRPLVQHILQDAGLCMRHTLSTIISSNESDISSLLGQNSTVQDDARLTEAATAGLVVNAHHRISRVSSNSDIGVMSVMTTRDIRATGRMIPCQPDATNAPTAHTATAVSPSSDMAQQQHLPGYELSMPAAISQQSDSRTTPTTISLSSMTLAQGPGVCRSDCDTHPGRILAVDTIEQQMYSSLPVLSGPPGSIGSRGVDNRNQHDEPTTQGGTTLQQPPARAQTDNKAEAHQQPAVDDLARPCNVPLTQGSDAMPASTAARATAVQQEQLLVLSATWQPIPYQTPLSTQPPVLTPVGLPAAANSLIHGGDVTVQDDVARSFVIATMPLVSMTANTKLQQEQLQMLGSIKKLQAVLGIRCCRSSAASPNDAE